MTRGFSHWIQRQVLKGMAGTPTDECAYVASTVTDLPYFSSKVPEATCGRLRAIWIDG